jgi:hypothetical protein
VLKIALCWRDGKEFERCSVSATKTHLWKEEALTVGDSIVLSAAIESPTRGLRKLWYRIPSEFSSLIGTSCDPFVVANIFLIMSEGADCIVHDQVSPSLLRNLVEFQGAWALWYPNKYKQVEITADGEREEPRADLPAQAIATFTGGLDSSFTVFRHKKGLCNKRWQRNIEAGVLVHGYDIPLQQEEAFERAAVRMRRTLASLDIKLLTMSTNLLELNPDWEDTHVAGVASALMLFKRHYQEGLIASGPSYDRLVIPWGSNPMTDHWLSSDSFQIVHDGADVMRLQKRRLIAEWPEGFENLRVCFSAGRRDENCGSCGKCVCDILNFRIIGNGVPSSFPPLSDTALSQFDPRSQPDWEGFSLIAQRARDAGVTDTWVDVLDERIKELQRSTKLEQLVQA